MSASGLLRRRGGANKGTQPSGNKSRGLGSFDGDDLNTNLVNEIDDDHKVGYDKHDIKDPKELNLPLLTLMEEVLLIGLKDKEGYLSFWNDNISYALRGCILLELTFRNKISLVNDPARRSFDLADRLLEVTNTEPTGEVLLDEALKIMKQEESRLLVTSWIDLLSGETWNLMKISYQLKHVRERIAKGLVDKGILRTERKNFFFFDMATHPVADKMSKEHIKQRILNLLTQRTVDLTALSNDQFTANTSLKYLRTIALTSGAYAANVLENILATLSYDKRDQALARADELQAFFSEAPFNLSAKSSLGLGANLGEEVSKEIEASGIDELQLELISAVLSVFAGMDSIL